MGPRGVQAARTRAICKHEQSCRCSLCDANAQFANTACNETGIYVSDLLRFPFSLVVGYGYVFSQRSLRNNTSFVDQVENLFIVNFS